MEADRAQVTPPWLLQARPLAITRRAARHLFGGAAPSFTLHPRAAFVRCFILVEAALALSTAAMALAMFAMMVILLASSSPSTAPWAVAIPEVQQCASDAVCVSQTSTPGPTARQFAGPSNLRLGMGIPAAIIIGVTSAMMLLIVIGSCREHGGKTALFAFVLLPIAPSVIWLGSSIQHRLWAFMFRGYDVLNSQRAAALTSSKDQLLELDDDLLDDARLPPVRTIAKSGTAPSLEQQGALPASNPGRVDHTPAEAMPPRAIPAEEEDRSNSPDQHNAKVGQREAEEDSRDSESDQAPRKPRAPCGDSDENSPHVDPPLSPDQAAPLTHALDGPALAVSVGVGASPGGALPLSTLRPPSEEDNLWADDEDEETVDFSNSYEIGNPLEEVIDTIIHPSLLLLQRRLVKKPNSAAGLSLPSSQQQGTSRRMSDVLLPAAVSPGNEDDKPQNEESSHKNDTCHVRKSSRTNVHDRFVPLSNTVARTVGRALRSNSFQWCAAGSLTHRSRMERCFSFVVYIVPAVIFVVLASVMAGLCYGEAMFDGTSVMSQWAASVSALPSRIPLNTGVVVAGFTTELAAAYANWLPYPLVLPEVLRWFIIISSAVSALVVCYITAITAAVLMATAPVAWFGSFVAVAHDAAQLAVFLTLLCSFSIMTRDNAETLPIRPLPNSSSSSVPAVSGTTEPAAVLGPLFSGGDAAISAQHSAAFSSVERLVGLWTCAAKNLTGQVDAFPALPFSTITLTSRHPMLSSDSSSSSSGASSSSSATVPTRSPVVFPTAAAADDALTNDAVFITVGAWRMSWPTAIAMLSIIAPIGAAALINSAHMFFIGVKRARREANGVLGAIGGSILALLIAIAMIPRSVFMFSFVAALSIGPCLILPAFGLASFSASKNRVAALALLESFCSTAADDPTSSSSDSDDDADINERGLHGTCVVNTSSGTRTSKGQISVDVRPKLQEWNSRRPTKGTTGEKKQSSAGPSKGGVSDDGRTSWNCALADPTAAATHVLRHLALNAGTVPPFSVRCGFDQVGSISHWIQTHRSSRASIDNFDLVTSDDEPDDESHSDDHDDHDHMQQGATTLNTATASEGGDDVHAGEGGASGEGDDQQSTPPPRLNVADTPLSNSPLRTPLPRGHGRYDRYDDTPDDVTVIDELTAAKVPDGPSLLDGPALRRLTQKQRRALIAKDVACVVRLFAEVDREYFMVPFRQRSVSVVAALFERWPRLHEDFALFWIHHKENRGGTPSDISIPHELEDVLPPIPPSPPRSPGGRDSDDDHGSNTGSANALESDEDHGAPLASAAFPEALHSDVNALPDRRRRRRYDDDDDDDEGSFEDEENVRGGAVGTLAVGAALASPENDDDGDRIGRGDRRQSRRDRDGRFGDDDEDEGSVGTPDTETSSTVVTVISPPLPPRPPPPAVTAATKQMAVFCEMFEARDDAAALFASLPFQTRVDFQQYVQKRVEYEWRWAHRGKPDTLILFEAGMDDAAEALDVDRTIHDHPELWVAAGDDLRAATRQSTIEIAVGPIGRAPIATATATPQQPTPHVAYGPSSATATTSGLETEMLEVQTPTPLSVAPSQQQAIYPTGGEDADGAPDGAVGEAEDEGCYVYDRAGADRRVSRLICWAGRPFRLYVRLGAMRGIPALPADDFSQPPVVPRWLRDDLDHRTHESTGQQHQASPRQRTMGGAGVHEAESEGEPLPFFAVARKGIVGLYQFARKRDWMTHDTDHGPRGATSSAIDFEFKPFVYATLVGRFVFLLATLADPLFVLAVCRETTTTWALSVPPPSTWNATVAPVCPTNLTGPLSSPVAFTLAAVDTQWSPDCVPPVVWPLWALRVIALLYTVITALPRLRQGARRALWSIAHIGIPFDAGVSTSYFVPDFGDPSRSPIQMTILDHAPLMTRASGDPDTEATNEKKGAERERSSVPRGRQQVAVFSAAPPCRTLTRPMAIVSGTLAAAAECIAAAATPHPTVLALQCVPHAVVPRSVVARVVAPALDPNAVM